MLEEELNKLKFYSRRINPNPNADAKAEHWKQNNHQDFQHITTNTPNWKCDNCEEQQPINTPMWGYGGWLTLTVSRNGEQFTYHLWKYDDDQDGGIAVCNKCWSLE